MKSNKKTIFEWSEKKGNTHNLSLTMKKVKVVQMYKRAIKISFLLIFGLKFSAYSQNSTLVISEKDGKYGVRNNKGETVIEEKYASVILLSDNNMLVYEENPGWPMVINQKGEILVSKTNYIGKVLDAFANHFICQYYKDGKMADIVLIKAPDVVLYNFPLRYTYAEFVRDSCYTYVSAQTLAPGEKLSIDINGKIIAGADNADFDYIKEILKPCNGLAVVLKNKGYEGTLSGVYDLNNKKMIIPCDFSDIELEKESKLIKAFDRVYTSTYSLYDMKGKLIKTWDQIKK